MPTSAAQTLRYVLPTTTAARLSAQVRLSVAPDPQGGHLVPQVAVRLLTRSRAVPVLSITDVPVPSPQPAWAEPGSLRRLFDRTNPRMAALIADLSARSEQFLAGLRMGEDVNDVITAGQALEVVHRELAGADRMRREWTCQQGKALRTSTWDLDEGDLLPLEYPSAALPGDVALPGGDAAELAEDYGLLLAAASGETHVTTLVVYRRPPRRIPDLPEADSRLPWTCDPGLSHLRISDDAGLPRQREALDDLLSANAPIDTLALQSAFDGSPADLARRQLALLEASDEYSRLASTHCREEELKALELLMRLGGSA